MAILFKQLTNAMKWSGLKTLLYLKAPKNFTIIKNSSGQCALAVDSFFSAIQCSAVAV